MSGEAINIARKTPERMINGRWATVITLKDTSGFTAEVNGLAINKSDVWQAGNNSFVVDKLIQITFIEKNLQEAGFTTRNNQNMIVMRDWVATFLNPLGEPASYVLSQSMPNETTGMLPCLFKQAEKP